MKVRIIPSENEYDGNDIVKITYNNNSRYTLGTEPVSAKEFSEIKKRVAKKELVGIHVWAYVHSGSMVRAADTNPFSCQFDSGLSGIAYMTRESAIAEFSNGSKRLTSKAKEMAIKYIIAVVDEFSAYLEGNVWDVIATDDDGNFIDSIYSIVGYENAEKEVDIMINGIT